MKSLVILFSTVVLLSSCSRPYVSEINTIDSLLVKLDSSKKALFSLDTGIIFRRIKQCDKNLNSIYSLADTIDREGAFLIDDYANCRKSYQKMSTQFPSIFEEIEVIPLQLKNLRKDLSKDLIPQNKAKLYTSKESFAAVSIINAIHELNAQQTGLEEIFITSHEKILHLIQTLESSKKNDEVMNK